MSDGNALQDKRKHAEAVVDATVRRDFEALAELVDPEMEFRSVLADVEGLTYKGIDGMRRWAEDTDATWDDWQAEIVEFREVGDDRTVVVSRVTGKAKASGVPLDVRLGQVWTWRDGKPWRNDSWTDPNKAFEAAGLGE
jgi:ketosteroid isomerase-like protein